MDIKIEIPRIASSDALKNTVETLIQKKFGCYPFVKVVDVKMAKHDNDELRTSLNIKPEKGKMLYTEGIDVNQEQSLKKAITKMKSQIEKYKEIHYSSSHKSATERMKNSVNK